MRKIPPWSTALSSATSVLILCIVFLPSVRGRAAATTLMVLVAVIGARWFIDHRRLGLLKLPAKEAARLAPPLGSVQEAIEWFALVGGGVAMFLAV